MFTRQGKGPTPWDTPAHTAETILAQDYCFPWPSGASGAVQAFELLTYFY